MTYIIGVNQKIKFTGGKQKMTYIIGGNSAFFFAQKKHY